MAKVVKFEDFQKKVELEELKDLKRSFSKNSVDKQQFPRNTKYHYNDKTKKMDDLSVEEVDDKIEGLEESNGGDFGARPVKKAESIETKSLKWYISLSFDEQVELAFELIKGPSFNLTIRDIMYGFEQYKSK